MLENDISHYAKKKGNFLRVSDTCLVLKGIGKMPLNRGERKTEIYIDEDS